MKILPALAAFGLAVLLSGCTTSPRTTGTIIRSHPSDNIRENSPLVARYLLVREIKYDKEMNSLMRVQIQIANIAEEDLTFEYRFRWFDENQFEVKSIASTWLTINCIPRDTANIQAVAPAPQVEDFEIMIRYPDTW